MSIREVLTDLADTFGVPLDGLDDDQLNIIAVRLINEYGDAPTAVALGKVVDSVRFASVGSGDKAGDGGTSDNQSARTSSIECPGCIPVVVPFPSGHFITHSRSCSIAPRQKIRRARELHERKEIRRLAKVHRIEDARVGVWPRVTRQVAVHPACKAAFHDGGEPCEMCLYRLCTDEACSHPVCGRERGWNRYFG